MIIYVFGGIGADERVVEKLNLKHEIRYIEYIVPDKNETINSYCNRLGNDINASEEIAFLGISFGGIIAQELSKKFNPKYLILISSYTDKSQIYKIHSLLVKTGILGLIPKSMFTIPKVLLPLLFGTKSKAILSEIVNDTDKKLIKWSLTQIPKWEPKIIKSKLLMIHGEKDLLIPIRKGTNLKISNGGHFIIYDSAEKISKYLNLVIDK